ncbi:MAG: DUF11 domain-containing protein, partial [Bacteroidales bacterium]|nr:DUF11 domain-containing protein [Bacteroidales bacterium]
YHTISNTGGGDASGFPHNTYRLPDNSDWYVSTPVGAVQSHWEMTNFDPLSVIAQNTGIQLKGEVETRYYEVIWEDGQGGQLLENNAPTAVYEFKIPRNLLGNDNPSAGDSVGIQWASGCRNDGNNTSGLFKYGTIDGQVDLGVQKSVYNAVPQAGEQSVFTITLTNYSQDQTAHHVVVEDILDAAFTYVSSNTSTGSYDHVAGEWHLDELAPQSEATLTITVTVQASADNLARLTDLDETDTNPNNNEDWVSVTISGSSGGNDGGLESNGSLAALIAQRNFSRVKNSTLGQMNHRQDVPAFSEQLAKTNIIIPAGRMKDGINVAALLPEAGPFQSTGYVTTPEDLTRITNANQVFSIDYFNTQDKRMGAILAITTENKVYNHTKAICDRMTGASLDMIRTVMIRDHAFILNKLVEPSGSVDYTVSFIAYQKDGKMVIDNRWHNEEYRPGNSDVLNFQVWSVTPQSTTAMVDELLSRLDEVLPLQFHTREVPKVPELFAHNGYYEDGLIHLDIHNPAGNNMVRIKGSLTRYENAPREPFEFAIPVNPDQADQQISLPTGYLFDADFSLANNVDPARDALYYADGPWGRDLDPDGAQINNFTVTPYNGTTFDESLLLERDARISGSVRTYASLFRALKPGNIPVDLTGYGQLVFEATGRGSIELAISKESIKNWSNQYRTQFELEPSWKTYTIDLSQLRSTGNSKLFTPEDVLAVVFNALGDGQTSRDFDLQIRNLRFKKGSSDLNTVQPNGFSLNCYPNPFRNVTTLQFNLPDDARAQILLYNIQGQEIMTIADRRFNAGINRIELNLQNLEQGIYLVKMNSNYYSETYRLNLLK